MPVPEMAGRDKALREASTFEVAPGRTVRKAARAGRPVTARIHERMVEQPVVTPQVAVAMSLEPSSVEQAVARAAAAGVIPLPEPAEPDHRRAMTRRRQDEGSN